MNLSKKQKYFAIGISGAVAIMLIVGLAAFLKQRSAAGVPSVNSADVPAAVSDLQPAATTTPTSTVNTIKKSKPPAANTAKKVLTYEEASKLYAGHKFQFDANCQASPMSMIVKNGASIMLDNRGGTVRNVSIGAKKYSLAAYNFLIITIAESKPFPKTLSLSCGSQYNIAKITVLE